MTQGRKICDVLKSIRKEIAHANGIQYAPVECHYEGECLGTCPTCDAEARYLNRELELRKLAGKTLRIAGLSLGMVTLSACGIGQVSGYMGEIDSIQRNENTDSVDLQTPSVDGADQSLNITNFQ